MRKAASPHLFAFSNISGMFSLLFLHSQINLLLSDYLIAADSMEQNSITKRTKDTIQVEEKILFNRSKSTNSRGQKRITTIRRMKLSKAK